MEPGKVCVEKNAARKELGMLVCKRRELGGWVSKRRASGTGSFPHRAPMASDAREANYSRFCCSCQVSCHLVVSFGRV